MRLVVLFLLVFGIMGNVFALSVYLKDVVLPKSKADDQIYMVPVEVDSHDPYSTLKFYLAGGDKAFSDVRLKVEPIDKSLVNLYLSFQEPLVEDKKVLLRVSYLGKSKLLNVVIPVVADKEVPVLETGLTVKEEAGEASGQLVVDNSFLSEQQAIVEEKGDDFGKVMEGLELLSVFRFCGERSVSLQRGSLKRNVERILADCSVFTIENWPEQGGNYVDFVIDEDLLISERFPKLQGFLTWLRESFGLLGIMNEDERVLDFILM